MQYTLFVLIISFLFITCGQNDTKKSGPDTEQKQFYAKKFSGDGLILPETDLQLNHKYHSPDSRYFAMFQTDGNFVLYEAGTVERPIWSSRTQGTGANKCRFQDDGTIVIYKDATPLKVFGRLPLPEMKTCFLKVQEDGSLVIYADYRNGCLWVPLWGSGHLVWSDDEINRYITTHPCRSTGDGGSNAGGDGTVVIGETWLCPGQAVPAGWLVVDGRVCISCGTGVSTTCRERKIEDGTKMASGTELTICPSSPIPSGWTFIRSEICAGRCGTTGGETCYVSYVRKR